jgi:hypothetical protein
MAKSEKKKIVAHLRQNEATSKTDASISFRRAADMLLQGKDRDEVWAEIIDGLQSFGEAVGHGNAAADVEEEAWR